MDRQVKWAKSAWSDLEDTADFIAKDSPYYAASFVQEVLSVAKSLNKHSERGRIVPEFDQKTIRELFVRDYRLIYQVTKKHVSILAFIHGARDLKRITHKKSSSLKH